MPKSFVYRKQAIEHAEKNGYVGFRTKLNEDDMWVATDESKSIPIIYKAEWINHLECMWENNHLNTVLVVTITLDELKEMGVVTERVDGLAFFVPKGLKERFRFIVDPFVPQLWRPDLPVDKIKKAKEQRKVTEPKIPRAITEAGPAQSTTDSPVKKVHAMCDSMPNASRKEIIEACIAIGINKSTAGTQYYHWKKART